MFAAMDDGEKLVYLISDVQMENKEHADFNWEKCTLHV
jgi:hypothetical protein